MYGIMRFLWYGRLTYLEMMFCRKQLAVGDWRDFLRAGRTTMVQQDRVGEIHYQSREPTNTMRFKVHIINYITD